MDDQEILDAEVEVIELTAVQQEPGLLLAVKYLVSVAVYCVIGLAVDYWLFVAAGAVTAWANPITYMVMLFWPFILLWKFLVICFWIAVVCLVIWMAYALITRNI